MKQTASFLLYLFLCACSVTEEYPEPENITACQVIYDAGSSGTRLYIYRQTAAGWIKHIGPTMAALADPVRGNRNKSMADAEVLTDYIVAAVSDIQKAGPLKKDGSFEWLAFDWPAQCRLDKVAVYATAGMRLAERSHPANAEQLWKLLNRKLEAQLGMAVTTRTLTGFEEGLFAWLASREEQSDDHFGIVEMGGASAQISFPCASCKASRQVKVKGGDVSIVSFSFLGLGQDEAWKKQTRPSECSHGVGLSNPDWNIADCSDGIEIPAIVGQEVRAYVKQANIQRWQLAGAFKYSEYEDIDNYCRDDIDSGYKPETSCFRAVYQPYFLNSIGVPISSNLSDTDWTLGAVICTFNDCLANAGPP